MSPRSRSAETVVLALDDTDAPGTRGTGRLARSLAGVIHRARLGDVAGVTRHQLFEGPGVPKTSHNSAAAIEIATNAPEAVLDLAARMIVREHAPGSDPGVAVLGVEVHGDVLSFARSAQRRVVERAAADELAARHGVALRPLGGSGGGVIGALAAAALRRSGDDGRFIDLGGVRTLRGTVGVDDLLEFVDAVVDEDGGRPLPASAAFDTGDWVRPRLAGGRAVLVARRDHGRWVNADLHPR